MFNIIKKQESVEANGYQKSNEICPGNCDFCENKHSDQRGTCQCEAVKRVRTHKQVNTTYHVEWGELSAVEV